MNQQELIQKIEEEARLASSLRRDLQKKVIRLTRELRLERDRNKGKVVEAKVSKKFEGEIRDKEIEIDKLNIYIEHLRSDLDKIRAEEVDRNTTFDNSLKEIQERSEKEIAELQSREEKLEARLENAHMKIETLSQENEGNRQIIRKHNTIITELKDELEAVRLEKVQIEKNNHLLKSSVRSFEENGEELIGAISQRDSKIVSLEDGIERYEGIIEGINRDKIQLTNKIGSLQDTVDTLERDRTEVNERYNDLYRKYSLLKNDVVEKESNFKNENVKLEGQKQTLKEKLISYTEAVKKLKKACSDRDSFISSLKAKTRAQNTSIESKTREIKKLKETGEELTENFQRLSSKHSELISENKNMNEKVQRLTQNFEAARHTSRAIEEQRKALENKNSKISAENNMLKKQVERLQKALDNYSRSGAEKQESLKKIESLLKTRSKKAPSIDH